MSDYYDELETRRPEQRAEAQFAQLREQLAFAKQHAPAYVDALSEFDTNQINDRDSLAALPVTRKSELVGQHSVSNPLAGLITKPLAECKHVYASPGPIYEPEDFGKDYWRFARALYAANFRRGDLAYNTFSYHLTPAGVMLESGAHAIGCGVVPAGPGQTDIQIQTINDLQPNAYVGTPSFLRILIDKAREQGNPINSFEKAMVSGEALPADLRQSLKDEGISVYQSYAIADLGLIAYESPALDGLIVDEDIIVEIVRPGSGDPVADGEVGEVLVTLLNNRCYPLVRFATGDLSAFAEGDSACGRTNQRIKGWMGRADQTTKVRGMFVRPEQINHVLKAHPDVIKARLIVSRTGANDDMMLRCESNAQSPSLADAIEQSLRDACKLRGVVELVAAGTLPNDGKVIEDTRPVE